MEKFRTLRADEIDCRIAQVKSNGLSLLLYKDARCDMNILDETVKPENWQRSHSRDNANCTVSIWDSDKKQWIAKEDTGTESFTEKGKGLASDSFKRACFNWGIGRELYTAPFIWVSSDDCTIKNTGKKDAKGQDIYTCKDNFCVSRIDYDDNRVITELQIKHSKTHKVVFEMGKTDSYKPTEQPKEEKPKLASKVQVSTIKSICKKHNVDADAWICGNDRSWDTLTANEAGQMLSALKQKYGDD